MKYLILLLLSFNANAFMLKIDYVAPVEREDETAMTQEEIAGYNVYYVECVKDYVKGEPVETLLTNVRSYWFVSTKPVQCLIFNTVDTDGRVSDDSEILIARDFRAPKEATCTP